MVGGLEERGRLILHQMDVRGFRSIRHARLELEPVTLLVGANGAGKSNLIDALRFVSDAVQLGLESAVGRRGDRQTICYKGGGTGQRSRPIRIECDLRYAHQRDKRGLGYGFEIAHDAESETWEVQGEWMWRGGQMLFHTQRGRVLLHTEGFPQTVTSEQLHTPLAAHEDAAEMLGWLRNTIAYAPDVEQLKQPQLRNSAKMLTSSGANLAHVWRRLKTQHPAIADRVVLLLRQVVPDIQDIGYEGKSAVVLVAFFRKNEDDAPMGASHAQEGHPNTHEAREAWGVPQRALSDGTLRALALLVALYQPHTGACVAIEELELLLHPNASGLLFEALLSAPDAPQLIISTHAPAVLESKDAKLEMIRVVRWTERGTVVGGLDASDIEDIREHLTSSSELLAEGRLKGGDAAHGRWRSIGPWGQGQSPGLGDDSDAGG